MKKFKQRWGIKTNYQLVVILIVFALTGSCAAYFSRQILIWANLTKDTISPWLYYILYYIVILFPVYQVLLLFFGFIFGQIKFFRAFEKKMLKAIGLGFLFSNKK